jgi:hypothetical protein
MARRMLIVLLALAAAAAVPAAAQASQRLSGAGFRTLAPSDWHVRRSHSDGWRRVQVASPVAHGDNLPNTVRITIAWISARSLHHRIRKAVPRDPVKLEHLLLGVPQTATNINAITQPTATTLAAWPGGLSSVSYVFENTALQQTDIALNRHGRVYQLQVLADSGLAQVGSTALDMVRTHWRWR